MRAPADQRRLTVPNLHIRACLAAALVFAGTCGVRFIGVEFTNDDLLFLAIGRQIAVFHEWPVRDLFEEGDPLHNVASAALQSIGGYSLAGEALFDIGLLALAAALVMLLAARWLRSAALGALVAAVTVVAWPRLYDYPKALIPALGLWLCGHYQQRPSRWLAAVTGLAVGVAFLLRHDFGVYAAGAAAVAIVASHWPARRAVIGRLVTCAAASLIVAGPYLVFVQAHVGIANYIAAAQRFTEREVARSDDRPPAFAFDWSRALWESAGGVQVKVRWTAGVGTEARIDAERRYSLARGEKDEGTTWKYVLRDATPGNVYALVRDPRVEDTANIDRTIARGAAPAERSRLRRWVDVHPAIAPGVLTRENAVAWLYYVYRFLPWLVAVVALAMYWRGTDLAASAPALPPLAFCLLSSALLLRGNLYENSRLADFTTPSVLLAVAFGTLAWRVRGRWVGVTIRSAIVAIACVSIIAAGAFGRFPRRVATVVALMDEQRLNEETSRLWDDLVSTPPPLRAVPRENGVRGAVEYLRRCTRLNDRVLVFGFFPDVLYFSGRPAAADRIVLLRGFGVAPDEEQRTVTALMKHPARLAIVETNEGSGSSAGKVLDGLHPLVEGYIAARYSRVATTAFGASTDAMFDVWIDRQAGDRMRDGCRGGEWNPWSDTVSK
jgi:hypothetical protein